MSTTNGRTHILVLEEDQKVAGMIEKTLSKNGFVVDVTHESKTAVTKGLTEEYQLAMADVCQSEGLGFEFLRALRDHTRKVPFLALAERDKAPVRLKALQEGADDFVIKPFDEEELLARVQSVLWRAEMSSSTLLYASDLTMDVNKRVVRRSSKAISLTRTEFSLLELLLKNKNIVLPRPLIREKVWGSKFDDGTNIVDVYINYLRTSIDKDFSPKLIRTVRGKGFVLKEN